MLSRNNKILIGCLALLLVMSVGYALFSDTITINGSATAQGDFNITPACISGTVLELGFSEHGYKNEYCNADDTTDTVSFGAEFDYPGARKVFSVKFTNTGSINSTLPLQIELDSGTMCFADSLDKDAQTEGECTTFSGGNYTSLIGYAVQIGDGTIYDTTDLTALPSDVQLAFHNGTTFVLKPGNSVYYYLTLVAADVSNSNNVLNEYLSASYNATFEQLTD